MKHVLKKTEIDGIYAKALDDFLQSLGFDLAKEILRWEQEDPMGEVDSIVFEQDNTPDIGGDNIECEYLKALRGETNG